jgi:hypothetical protein
LNIASVFLGNFIAILFCASPFKTFDTPKSTPYDDRTMNVSEFIDALGGTCAAARIFRVTPPAVSNWKKANALPARLHLRAIREAASRGIAFDPEAPNKAKRKAA